MSRFSSLKRLLIALLLALVLPLSWALAQAQQDEEEPDEAPVSGEVSTGGVVRHVFPVLETDPNLLLGNGSTDTRKHVAYIDPKAKDRHQLLLWMPGTHGTATKGEATAFLGTAAREGYHVLSITYISGVALAALHRFPDPDAFLKGRNNNLYGDTPIGKFQTDKSNSIINRTVKALRYLDKQYPEEGWGEYLHGDEPAWAKMVPSGLSQGGGYAVLLGVQHRVARVVAFGAPKDITKSRGPAQPVRWYGMNKATPLEAFFLFNHSGDEGHGCTYQQQVVNYRALGLLPRYPIVNVDNARSPYQHSRLLTTLRPADVPKHNHGLVSHDSFYKDAWRYMLTEPIP